ncbi:glycosyltransferase [Plantactinospora sp. S1510]|uniref:Glycosyltransferase n=1 Tax=Plantactinospora alkalitolerans TaxID=2789879 RepID=A0ABS0H0V7_9ACTN|nr:glycosyltransferase family 4 protein [Plantactinospora alkalitolerans]MBF9131799.1 glycosyltransferase [Plantactinospora alkalitolerans]
MGLTVVSTFFPLPPDRGDPVRVLMMLRAISRIQPFTLAVVRRPDTTGDQLDQLGGMLPEVEVRDYPATPYRLDRLGPFGRYPEAMADGLPPWIRSRYSQPLHDDLRTRDGAGIAIGEAAAVYFRGTRLRWHWDKANVLAGSTRGDIAEAEDLAHQLRARYLAGISTRFESRALSECETVSVTSAEEATRLAEHHRRRADFTLPSCVPMPVGHVPRPQERHLVWLSSFSYRANLAGLRHFLDRGWPSLRRAGFRLTLVGSGLTDRVRASLAAIDGVDVPGYVADLRPVLARARAAVVPVWSGAGVKLKTLTLLAHSVPVFTTPVGAEGVPATEAVRLADTPEALAAEILGSSAAELDAMVAAGARLIEGQFSEDRFAERLVDALARHGYLDVTGTSFRQGI